MRSRRRTRRDERCVPPGRALWTTEGEPGLLDRDGSELVLVGVDDEPERELGIDVLPGEIDAGPGAPSRPIG